MKKRKTRKPASWKKRYHELNICYQECSGNLLYSLERNNDLEDRIEKAEDYIRWKGLWNDYSNFKENAHQEYDPDLPFPSYVL